MSVHFIVKCKHGVVISQCRCPFGKKTETIVSCPVQCKEKSDDAA